MEMHTSIMWLRACGSHLHEADPAQQRRKEGGEADLEDGAQLREHLNQREEDLAASERHGGVSGGALRVARLLEVVLRVLHGAFALGPRLELADDRLDGLLAPAAGQKRPADDHNHDEADGEGEGQAHIAARRIATAAEAVGALVVGEDAGLAKGPAVAEAAEAVAIGVDGVEEGRAALQSPVVG